MAFVCWRLQSMGELRGQYLWKTTTAKDQLIVFAGSWIASSNRRRTGLIGIRSTGKAKQSQNQHGADGHHFGFECRTHKHPCGPSMGASVIGRLRWERILQVRKSRAGATRNSKISWRLTAQRRGISRCFNLTSACSRQILNMDFGFDPRGHACHDQ